MPALILYLLKANVALLLFYLAYHFVLRRLTFYHLNRLFLVFGILFSATYPFVDLSAVLQQNEELGSKIAVMAQSWQAVEVSPATESGFMVDGWWLISLIFWAGVACMLLRLALQLLSLRGIHTRSSLGRHAGFTYRNTPENINPFSFWQSIYLNPELHRQEELLPILRHEQVHVKEWHTLDVLLAEAGLLLNWFNPGVWLLKDAMRENLEFIADRKVLQTGLDAKTYQYSLVRISSLAPVSVLGNNFNFLTIKKRIAMMNKKQSSLLHVARYAVLVPLTAAPMLLFTACNEEVPEIAAPASIAEQASTEASTPAAAALYYLDGKESTKEAVDKVAPEEIQSVNVIKGETALEVFGKGAASGVIAITTKKNQNAPAVLEFNQKLPVLPPPPPPVSDNIVEYVPAASDHAADYKSFLKRNPEIDQVGWKIKDMDDRFIQMMVVHLKSGETEIYDLSHGGSRAMAQQKYGELPNLPPPPPPVRVNKL
ncbi:hypothetical protein MKJ04_03735 [Pontibacter sp. E15-1]|uniref:M56 family metallopeptidase n=1 Tax=Pontibacter sp. E15-1 TaxID=2919918 RepID=UPI001F4F90EB|nr:M56 family metallopeptidase [Pontibacter sp. E15-1]MCJ8163939.1 hypothetical protein [Pontibacter sp. E15-1]